MTSFSDNFAGTGALNATNWNTIADSPQRAAGTCAGTGNAAANVNNAAFAFSADTEVSITLAAITQEPGIFARLNPATLNGYQARIQLGALGAASSTVLICTVTAGVPATLQTISNVTINLNDVFKLRTVASGLNTALTVYQNGSQIGTFTETPTSTAAAGTPGFGLVGAGDTLSLFAAADFGGGADPYLSCPRDTAHDPGFQVLLATA